MLMTNERDRTTPLNSGLHIFLLKSRISFIFVATNVKSFHKIINVAFNVKLKLLVIEFECTEDKHNFRDMNLEIKEEGRAMSGQNICRPPEQELRPNDREKSALPCLMRRVLNRNLFEGNYKTRYCGQHCKSLLSYR